MKSVHFPIHQTQNGSLNWAQDVWSLNLFLFIICCLNCELHYKFSCASRGQDRVKVWIRKGEKITLKMHPNTIFIAFGKKFWILKSGCSQKSSTHGFMWTDFDWQNLSHHGGPLRNSSVHFRAKKNMLSIWSNCSLYNYFSETKHYGTSSWSAFFLSVV